MKFQPVHIDRANYYALGIDEETGTHVLTVVAGTILLYTLYFRLTPEEYHDYPHNKAFIDDLAKSCARGVHDGNRGRHIMT